jgi:hypothetical protein
MFTVYEPVDIVAGTLRVPDHMPSEAVPELSARLPIPFPLNQTNTDEIVLP